MRNNFIDLTGKVFGSLTILNRNGTRDKKPVWLCRCICGKVIERVTQTFTTRPLRNHNCGCLGNGPSQDPKESGLIAVIAYYKSNCKAKNQIWNLTKDQAKQLFISNCHYCNNEPKSTITAKNSYMSFTYNGIDRKDNNIGYEIDNCVPCCKECNFLKRNLNYSDFLKKIKKIYEVIINEI